MILAYILNIETATKNCSVSVAHNGIVLAINEINDGNYSHAERLHPFIDDTIKKAGITFGDLSAVAVSKGPGSYTGLRIGVSAAKGIAYSLNIPLISIDTLTSLGNGYPIEKGFIIPMLDARRMEVYSCVFNANMEVLESVNATIIDKDSYDTFLEKDIAYFIGDGAEKCKDQITHENARFIKNIFPSSKEMAPLSFEKFTKQAFEDVAYFEPFYLKDFVVLSKKKN